MTSVRGLDWQRRASCRGQWDLFFPPEHERPAETAARLTRAKAVCTTCPVTASCAGFAADERPQTGIWAGRDYDHDNRLCRNGLHVMDAANTYTDPGGGKNCRSCRAAADQRARARQNEEAA